MIVRAKIQKRRDELTQRQREAEQQYAELEQQLALLRRNLDAMYGGIQELGALLEDEDAQNNLAVSPAAGDESASASAE